MAIGESLVIFMGAGRLLRPTLFRRVRGVDGSVQSTMVEVFWQNGIGDEGEKGRGDPTFVIGFNGERGKGSDGRTFSGVSKFSPHSKSGLVAIASGVDGSIVICGISLCQETSHEGMSSPFRWWSLDWVDLRGVAGVHVSI